MKNLYYVSASQQEGRRETARCTLTAESEEDANDRVIEWLPGHWRVNKVVLICRVEAPVELLEL